MHYVPLLIHYQMAESNFNYIFTSNSEFYATFLCFDDVN